MCMYTFWRVDVGFVIFAALLDYPSFGVVISAYLFLGGTLAS